MRSFVALTLTALLLPACTTTESRPAAVATPVTASSATAAAAPVDHIAAAIADTHRPADDRARDAARKPAEMLAFAGVAAGQRVVDFIPGGGYFTRLLSAAVGSAGKVYAAAPPPPPNATAPDPMAAIAADPNYANVSVIPLIGSFAVPEPVDVIFTAQNYHDLHLTRLNVDVPALNRALFAALKPGGVLVIVDHSAVTGSGLDVVNTLHRIAQEIVVTEVTAAGFVLDGYTNVLRNSADPRTASAFDPSIRGQTDQFVLRFRKP